ncbi:hypothetical protein, partial [Paenibacillus sp.]|uniref:hypothetical protein n=1 Tax=Paenibacillus sp. TaxID=58172 RepID=UPI0025FCF8CD
MRSKRGTGSQSKQPPPGAARALKPRLAEQQGHRQPSEAAALAGAARALSPALRSNRGTGSQA